MIVEPCWNACVCYRFAASGTSMLHKLRVDGGGGIRGCRFRQGLGKLVGRRPLQAARQCATCSRFSDFEHRGNRAIVHAKTGKSFQPKYQRKPDAQSAAGGVTSSANDVARWLSLLLQNGNFEGRQYRPSGALIPAMTAQVISVLPFSRCKAQPVRYGFRASESRRRAGQDQLIPEPSRWVPGLITRSSPRPGLELSC